MSIYDVQASPDQQSGAPTTTVSTVSNGTSGTAAPPVTFKERLARRRKELEQNTTFELEIIGYNDLWARYRCLGYEESRAIGLQIEAETQDVASGERLTAAAVLAEACVELLEYKGRDDNGKPILASLGYRWTQKAAADLFDVYLPDGTSARDALLAIYPYPRDTLMMSHWQGYLQESLQYLPELEEVLRGESRGG